MRAVRGEVELLECALVGPRLRFRRNAVVAFCTPGIGVETLVGLDILSEAAAATERDRPGQSPWL